MLRDISSRLVAEVRRASPRRFQPLSIWVTPAIAKYSTRRFAIFNHWSPDGAVYAYVLWHLKCLKSMGFNIIFVSAASTIDSSHLPELTQLCTVVATRKNMGLDIEGWSFASKVLEDRLGLPIFACDEILCTNDSVFGPLYPLASIHHTMERRLCDFWGITISREHRPHVQSYYVVFKKQALKFLYDWLNSRPLYHSRVDIVQKGEIGLTVAATRAGLRMDSWVDLDDVLAQARGKLTTSNKRDSFTIDARRAKNPTHFLWKEIIEYGQSPFLKRDLIIGRARHHLDSSDEWLTLIRRLKIEYPTALVVEMLEKDRSP